jgi:hypothetical protein
MTTCAYCPHEATMRIIANPGQVCLQHALEFWTGLLAYAHDRSGPCVKDEMVCSCAACEEVSAAQLRASAIASVGRSPGDHEDYTIPLAS